MPDAMQVYFSDFVLAASMLKVKQRAFGTQGEDANSRR
jgi:hypothetical protein